MSLIATRIDLLNAIARANCEAGKVDDPHAKLWQVVTGCTGQGCAVGLDRCWSKETDGDKPEFNNFKPMFHEKRLKDILRTKKSYVIGIGWHGEIGESDEFLKIYRYMCSEWIDPFSIAHIYYILTKHPEVFSRFFGSWGQNLEPNFNRRLWIGTTVNQPSEIERIAYLARIPGRHFVMFEPLMGNWADPETENKLIIALTAAKVEQVAIGGWSRIPPNADATVDMSTLKPHTRIADIHQHIQPWQTYEYRVDGLSVRTITEIAHSCGAKVFYKHNLPQSVNIREAFNLGLKLRAVKEIAI